MSVDCRSSIDRGEGGWESPANEVGFFNIRFPRVSYLRVPFLFVPTLLSESLEQATVLAVAMKQRTAKLCNFSVLLFYCNCSISKIVDLPRLLFQHLIGFSFYFFMVSISTITITILFFGGLSLSDT